MHIGEAKISGDKELKLADFIVFDSEEGKAKPKTKRKPRQTKAKTEENMQAENTETKPAENSANGADDSANEEQSLF